MRKNEKMTSASGMKCALMLRVAPLALVLGLIPAASHADWIPSVLDERCGPQDVTGVSTAVRDSIEASVRRAEASIQAPTPVGDLSCLNDLMLQPLDIFSSIGGLLSNLQQGLANLSLSLDIDVSGMICQMAAEKWAELTQGLGGLDAPLSAFSGASANPLDRLASGSFETGGSSGLFSGFSGVMNLGNNITDPTYRGSITDYTPPSVEVSDETAAIPIFEGGSYIDSGEYSAEEVAAIEAANKAYNEALMKNMAEYMACIVVDNFEGSRLDGVGGGWGSLDAIWRSPNRTCIDPLTGLPSVSTTTLKASPMVVVPQNVQPETYQAPDAPIGQDRPETLPPADDSQAPETSSDPAASIWDLINKPAGTTP